MNGQILWFITELKVKSGGERNGPPYPLKASQKSSGEKKNENTAGLTSRNKIDANTRITISESKFTNYALDYDKSPDKAKAFETALGYNKKNYRELIGNIDDHLDKNNLTNRGESQYGIKYEQIMKLKGPNGKTANVLTAWMLDDEGLRLTSAYITKKKVKNES